MNRTPSLTSCVYGEIQKAHAWLNYPTHTHEYDSMRCSQLFVRGRMRCARSRKSLLVGLLLCLEYATHTYRDKHTHYFIMPFGKCRTRYT